MYLPFWSSMYLFFFVFLAGFIDSAAGGGGLISLPAYLSAGLPAHTAIGCNKFSASCGTTVSAVCFFKSGAVEWKTAAVSALCSFAASFLGMQAALKINPDALKTAFLFVLPVIAVFILTKKNFGMENKSAEVPMKKAFVLAASAGLAVGFYDGLIGPGTGTIAIIAYSAWLKYDLKTASGNAKILNLASNYASLIAVIMHHKVIYQIALPAAVCGIIGNYAGSAAALKKGSAFIRPLMIIVIALLSIKLFCDVFSV